MGSKQTATLLIAGSAPSLAEAVPVMESATNIWALNDAAFFLKDRAISFDRLFISDRRFIRDRMERLLQLDTCDIATFTQLQPEFPEALRPQLRLWESLGRRGVSLMPGRVYHGCSVFNFAFQVALQEGWQRIQIAGVDLPPPPGYTRIDGSQHLPEYVYPYQLETTAKLLRLASDAKVEIDILSPCSNLHGLMELL
ncbi:MAG: hypothetical protein CMM93_00960 [Rickettsiales bacterium]|mgnify:CR=1 FL=1|nr:hypothetical protein [Rickettsiales bacterium]